MPNWVSDVLSSCIMVIALWFSFIVLLVFLSIFYKSMYCMFQVAVPDIVEAAKDADILIFVVPHQFIRNICSTLLGKIKPTAIGLSLIKVSYFDTFWICLGQTDPRQIKFVLHIVRN